MRIVHLAVLLALVLSACVDQDERRSIELMNEGVEAFDVGEESMALEALESSTTYHRENHRAWFTLGQVHAAREEWEDAADAFDEAVALQPDDAMYQYRLGEALVESGGLQGAETHLGEALDQNERLYRAWYYLGRVYHETDRPAEAAEAWTRSAELNPYYGPPFIALGRLYLRWDMLDESVDVLEQAAENVRGEEDLTDVYFFLGLAHDNKQNRERAVQAFTDALDARAGNVEALLQRGLVYAEMGEAEEAEEDLRDFLERGGSGSDFAGQVANTRLRQLRARE